MKAGKLFFLILVLGFGAAVETSWSLREHLDFGPLGCRVLRGRFSGPSFSFEEQEVRKLAAGANVEVENAFGAVTIAPGTAGEVRVTLRKVVYLAPEQDARQFASRIRLSASDTGNGLRLSTNREEVGRGDEVGFETHLELALPAGTAVKVRNEHGRVEVRDVARAEITNSFDELRVSGVAGDAVLEGRHGDVSVSGIHGALTVSARHGNLEVQDVDGHAGVQLEHGKLTSHRTGALTVVLNHGDMEAQGVRGDLEFRGEHAGVQAEEVSGRAVVETSFEGVRLAKVGADARVKSVHGEVEVSDVKGGVVVSAEFDGVTLARIAGPVDVTVAHGGLHGEALAAGARVKTSGDDVVLDGFGGAVDVDAQRGGVHLRPSGAVTEAISVNATHGGIRLEVPTGSRFRLEASTRRGSLEINVPGLAVTLSDRDRVSGDMGGGGNLVRLTADHGDVNVSAGTAVAAKTP